MIDAGSARGRAFARLNRSLRRAARRQGAPVRTITETSNDSVRYPELIPTLLDWYENLDAKVALPAPRDRAQMLSALARSLITPDAPTEEAFRISAIHLESAEPGSAVHLHGVMLLLSTTASPSDPEHRAVMSRLGCDRSLGEGRAPILEWLVARKVSRRHPELLEVALGELEDPAVAPHLMRRVRRLPLDALPVGLDAAVRPYLDHEFEESRRQARLLLERVAEEPGAR